MFNRANSTGTIRILAFVTIVVLGLSQFTSYGTMFPILSTQNIYGENATTSAPVYDDFSDGVYTLEQGVMSPNSNWFSLWDGDGSMGVKQMHDGNNVLFLEPKPSTESTETRSALVLSALEYKDFVLSLDVMTERQLRQNTPPNPWEVAWIIWRWQDNTHFYYFNVAFDASEVGKYDGGQNPQNQKFLVSTETLTAVVGQWMHWDITVRGDHITVEVDGTRIFDFEDSSSFDTGKLGLYTEDAAVVFDNIRITPTMAGDDYIGDANKYQYVFTCTQYVPMFHCDYALNEFESSVFTAEFTKLLSATREPKFVDTEGGKALEIRANALESVNVKNSGVFKSEKFSLYVLFRPDNFENIFGDIVSYTNGADNAGWELYLLSNEDPSTRKLGFTVYNTEGERISPEVLIIPNEFTEIVASFDGEKVRLFSDGNLHSEADFIGEFNPDPGTPISPVFAGGSYCSCSTASLTIDEIRYYDYAIPDDQIKNIHSVNEGLVDRSPVGYWKFDGDLKDYSGLGNDAFYKTMIASMTFSSDGRLFYTEKNSGNIRVILSDGTLLERPFATISDVYVDWEDGLLGIALDSKFEDNHFIYVFYNYKDSSTDSIFGRIVRFTENNNKEVDRLVILDKIPTSKGFHTGGMLTFNKFDDKLYVFVGDATQSEKAQDLSTLYGKLLRLNRDGTIPSDNPFPGSPVYSYGHRNAYGIAFDNVGNGILAESGPELYDEINYIEKGGNYGWPTLQIPNMPPELFTNNSSIKPLRSYFQPPSPTQTIYYTDTKYDELNDTFVFGTVRGYLISVKIDFDKKVLLRETKIHTYFYPYLPTVATAVSPNGEIYFGGYGIYRLDSILPHNEEKFSFPVQVNSTNIRIASIDYLEGEGGNKMTINLEDESGPSSLSLKLQNSIFDRSEEDSLFFERETSLANDGKTMIELPYSMNIESSDKYETITLQLPNDYAKEDKLQLIISGSEVSVTKTVPELGMPAVTLIILISATIISTIAARRGLIPN